MSKLSNLRDMSIDELEATFDDLNRELFELLNEKKRSKKLEKPHMLRQKRKEKARLLTILHEKQFQTNNAPA